MRWSVTACGAILVLVACTALAKPGGHVTEERREYYQKTSQVIDTPVIYATDGGMHSFASNSDALSSTWAQNHMDQIRKMADRLRSEYNFRAHSGAGRKGGRLRHGYSTNSFDYSSFAGKSKEELDALTRQMTESMISDMKSGKLLYSQIAQPNYFEQQAAQQLESMSHSQDYSASQQQTENQQQQQSQDVFGVDDFRRTPQTVGVGGYHRTSEKKHYEYTSSHGGYQPIGQQIGEVEDMNRREEQSSIVYPTTVTIIGGKRYVTKKNCTAASSTQGSRSPYFNNYRTRTSSMDRVLENGRTVPIVLDQTQTSTYNKESDSYSKTQDQQQSVPVYPGSYFTDDHYDSQYGQTYDQNLPIQGQSQTQTSSARDNSQYNRVYQQIAVPTTSQTFTSGSSYVRHENQQIPVVIPTQQTVTSSSESYSKSEGQRQIPVIYPSSSSQRESTSYESAREHQAVPTPTISNSRHSIYKHLQSDTDTVPGYKPVVTIDSQTIDTMNEELNRLYQQRPSTIAKTENTEQTQEDHQFQQNIVIPDYTVTIHDQDSEDIRDQRVQSVRPTIATSQQTITDEHQQASVHYRPSYPAYGSQINRNDTEYHEKYQTRYPQQVISGSTYEKQEEDHYSREHQQPVPIFGQTSQQTEDVTTSETYRSREHQVPVVVGGSTSYQEKHYTDERQKQVPQKYETSETETTQTDQSTTYQRQKPVYVSGGSSHTVETEDQTRDSTQYRPYPTGHRTSETTSESEDTQSQSQNVYGGSSQHVIETEDHSQDSTRYRQYPMGHRTTQVTSESEDYWSQHHKRPSTAQTSTSETETEYSENSRSQYHPGGTLLTQSSHEQESEDIRRRQGQPGYTVTTQQNETTSTSSSGTAGGVQQTITIGTSQEATDDKEDTQVVVGGGYSHSGESTDSRTEWNEGGVYQPGGSERTREQSSYDHEQRQRPYGGGMRLEHSEYGSNVNRTSSSGGYGIGYITHQLTIEQQQEEWRRLQEERRRQQLLSTGIFEESALNRTFGNGGQVQVDVTQQGVYDGDEDRLRNGTAHLDQSHYGTSADRSTTSTSGKPGKIISEDRGDQPPQHYEEDYDMNEAEPGIGPYPNEPPIENQRAEPSTTPRYSPPYGAPLAPLVDDKDNQQSTLDVWPTTAGETEVQRTYHKKKTMITQTVPVLLGANGEFIHESGAASSGSQQIGSYHTGSAGSYQTEMSGGATLESDSLTQQEEDQGQSYVSESSSQQTSGGRGGYGSSVYGSEARYTSRPVSSATGGASRYSTGTSSSSVSYQGGGSHSQSSAYGHQQIQDEDSEDNGQQLQVGVFDIDDGQQSEDWTHQFGDQEQYAKDRDEELGNLRQEEEDQQRQHSSYSQSIDGFDDGQKVEGQSSSSYYQSHAAYSSHSSGSSGSSSSTASEKTEDQPPEIQVTEESANQEKPGFWRRVGQKAKDLFG